jgi:acetyl-CoA carboxylase biotin carboxyl carrier protein
MTVETTGTPLTDTDTGAAPGADERERLLTWVTRCATELGDAGPAPLRRIKVTAGDLTVDVEWTVTRPVTVPGGAVPPSTGHEAAPAAVSPGAPPGGVVVRAPMVGTFYRAPEPGAPPFVEVGDIVEPGRQIGIVEAMKLMNPIQAEQGGRVVEIAAADGAPVEYGQALLVLEPLDGTPNDGQ